MDILEIIKGRRSVRDFTEKELPQDAVNSLIEAVRWAPSAGNLQSRKFYFVFREDLRRQLAQAALNQKFVAAPPLVVVGCVDRAIARRYGDRGEQLYCIQDVAASVQNMMLLAHAKGLGTCWVGAFNEPAVVKVLDLPQHLRPVAMIPVGYPAAVPKAPRRVPAAEAVVIIE